MLFRGRAEEEFVSSLVIRGECTRVEPDRARKELASQQQSLMRLKAKLDSSNENVRFLASYDTLMRHVEMWLLSHGVRLGDSPHATMRTIIRHFGVDDPALGIDRIVAIRHAAKKNSTPVPPGAHDVLQRISESFRLKAST